MKELLAVVAYVLLLGGLGALVTLAFGKLTKWRLKSISIFSGSLLIPLLIAAYGIWLIHYHRSGPPNDVNGLAAFILIFLPAISLPVTACSSIAVARRISWVKTARKGN